MKSGPSAIHYPFPSFPIVDRDMPRLKKGQSAATTVTCRQLIWAALKHKVTTKHATTAETFRTPSCQNPEKSVRGRERDTQ